MNAKRRHLMPSQVAGIANKNRAVIAAHVPKPGRPEKELPSRDGNKHDRCADGVIAKSVGVGEATLVLLFFLYSIDPLPYNFPPERKPPKWFIYGA